MAGEEQGHSSEPVTFQRFEALLKRLIAVPKRELDRRIAAYRTPRKQKQDWQREKSSQ
ncbi:MAG: hypothetical protein HY699_09550 [Deltaproteobacteria bacterium]|nr:hypothetical protein [Deltaproteobacteria bacterium]